MPCMHAREICCGGCRDFGLYLYIFGLKLYVYWPMLWSRSVVSAEYLSCSRKNMVCCYIKWCIMTIERNLLWCIASLLWCIAQVYNQLVVDKANKSHTSTKQQTSFFFGAGRGVDTLDMWKYNCVDKSKLLSSKRYLCLHAREICYGGCRDIGLYLVPLRLELYV